MDITPSNVSTLQSYRKPNNSSDNGKKTDIESDNKTSNKGEITANRGVSVPEARKLLNDKIIAALDKVITQSSQTSVYELDPADFSPQKVADRILSFVGSAFANIDSNNKPELNEKLSQARAGIEKGFNDAKDILEGLSAFNGKVKENANETYDRLQQGLDQIKSNIDAGAPIIEGLFNKSTGQSEFGVEKSSRFAQSFEFELTTADGDKVSIKVNQSETNNESAYINNSTIDYRSTQISESSYAISITGDIDENEAKAIENLLGKMTEVANKYFSGDTQAALDKVISLGYNTSEIASYSLNLQETQRTKATSTYQNIGELKNDRPPFSGLGQITKSLQNYATQLIESYRQFENTNLFDQQDDQFQQLLNQISNFNGLTNNEQSNQQFQNFNKDILDYLN